MSVVRKANVLIRTFYLLFTSLILYIIILTQFVLNTFDTLENAR